MKDNQNNPFGVLEFLHWNHSWNSKKYPSSKEVEKAAKLMQEAGIGWVRMDFLWEDIEPKEGEFDFTSYDAIVDILEKYNIKILGILNYCATWASPDNKWNVLPRDKDNRLFLNYAGKVIERYKGRVQYWEVWNEPDSPTYWAAQDGLKTYCKLLKDVYLAAKEIDPDCKILNGGLSVISSVDKLYANGGGEYFDIMNIHIFENPVVNKMAAKAITAHTKLAYKVMSRNGDKDKKIWVTEIGCPGVPSGIKTANWWLGQNPNEREQAKWVEAVYSQLLTDRSVEKVFWAFFRDCLGHWSNGVDYFGLVRWDFSKKPSYNSYKKFYKNWSRLN